MERGNYFCRTRLATTVFKKIIEVETHYQKGVFPYGVVEVDRQNGHMLPTITFGEEKTCAFNIIKLQNTIACKLDLDISKYDDETTRAAKIFASLSEKSWYILILDDLWEVYFLDEVEIPEPTFRNGCKLVLTTQSLNICRGMNCKSIRMEILTEREAEKSFMDRVGHDVLGTPEVEPIVNEIVE
ncbi:putative disease resistance protein At1g63350 [Ziziphus jujuba]|uniref:Disease resistance protein At1g63350 n=2 Tax=Ziziphus jujuba TaxID=326968 RepID=A0A6P6FX81_ZIZJJ|nr:putative disease resistance protein At1g63350 [Ziziphus jujuba]KAH7546465.1 hypothetical protein FEM48_Zijuj01G0203600 [Ziziphus jujuba var. spinosa]